MSSHESTRAFTMAAQTRIAQHIMAVPLKPTVFFQIEVCIFSGDVSKFFLVRIIVFFRSLCTSFSESVSHWRVPLTRGTMDVFFFLQWGERLPGHGPFHGSPPGCPELEELIRVRCSLADVNYTVATPGLLFLSFRIFPDGISTASRAKDTVSNERRIKQNNKYSAPVLSSFRFFPSLQFNRLTKDENKQIIDTIFQQKKIK